jgi:hypothetical protein
MSKIEIETDLLNAEVFPSYMVFNKQQHDKDVSEVLPRVNTYNVSNTAPYSPSDIKAAHGADDIDVPPDASKKRVVIAITIGYNWPSDYVQACFNAMCEQYNITPRTLEIINLNSAGEKASLEEEAAALEVTNTLINQLKQHIRLYGATGTIIPDYNFVPTMSDTNSERAELWLGELLLDLWAGAMNPHAHIRIIGSGLSALSNTVPTLNDLFNTVAYASNDAKFSNNSNGTTDIVNMSWGASLGGNDYVLSDGMFSNPKICYFAPSGDYRVSTYPSTSINVLSVGGTTQYYNANGSNAAAKGPYHKLWVGANNTEDVEGGGIGSGTGFSVGYSKPSYQSNLAVLTNFTNRCTPDVVSIADSESGVNIFYVDRTDATPPYKMKQQLGGVSLAGPILCGLFSHLVQQSHNESGSALTTKVNDIGTSRNLQTFLYTNYVSKPDMFYDVVDGITTLPIQSSLGPHTSGQTFSAGVGYDIPTGMGVPMMKGIRNAMFSTTISTPTPPGSTPPASTPTPPPASTPPAPTPPASTPPASTPPASTPPASTPPAPTPPASTPPAPANPPVVNDIQYRTDYTLARTKIIYNINN